MLIFFVRQRFVLLFSTRKSCCEFLETDVVNLQSMFIHFLKHQIVKDFPLSHFSMTITRNVEKCSRCRTDIHFLIFNNADRYTEKKNPVTAI